MHRTGLLTRINRLEMCLILVCTSLFVLMIYSGVPGFFVDRYPDYSGETYIRLDHAYYHIWGNSVQVHAALMESYNGEPQPFEGDYHVILVNTNEPPTTSVYNETKTLKFRWTSENGSFCYHNTTISVATSSFSDVVTIGETINFDIRIQIEEDLLFEFFPLSFYEDLSLFQLDKGFNILSVEARFLESDAPNQVLMHYKLVFKKEEFNSTMQRAYGYQHVFGFSFYRNTTGEILEQRYFSDDGIGGVVWILPFSAHVLDEQHVEVEKGRVFCSFPLNTSLSANKIVFAHSAAWESYILDINPVTICFSPPVTAPLVAALVLSYVLYRKWQNLLLHLLKYKFFYASMIIATALSILQYTQTFSGPLSDSVYFTILSVIFAGFVSIGTTKNSFTQNEHRLFWKKIILIMILLSLYPVAIYVYHISSSGDLRLLRFFPPVLGVVILTFLGACLVGMIINSLISFVAGLFLLVSHLVIRLWYRIHKSRSPIIIFDASTDAGTGVSKSFSYCIFEFFLFSLWFVILISSSVPVSIGDLWETIWERNLLVILIPLSVIVYLLLLYESLNVFWTREGEKEKKTISPKLLYKFWSAFAVITFVTKLFWAGLSLSIFVDLSIMSYFLLIISSGFAIGFVGTSQIGMKHASEAITKISKRYREIQIQ